MLDEIQRYAYGLKFENEFMHKRAMEFDSWFSRIMAHAFPEDFEPVRPYGRQGDFKCDGFRRSDGTVFQCYAPDKMKLAVLVKKIKSDFNGAVVHWGTKMRRWEFVHNDRRGLPARVTMLLADLRATYPKITLAVCGYAELRNVTIRLDLEKLQDLFGLVPSGREVRQLDFQALEPVLQDIQRDEPDLQGSITVPSVAKLERNALSQDAAGLLRLGRQRENLVEKFFDNFPDPTLGEEIAQGFRVRYEALKENGLTSDEIFGRLQEFAGGMTGDPSRQAAVVAVLSYFFERCDIFEDETSVDAQ